jgi:hypothetical protein
MLVRAQKHIEAFTMPNYVPPTSRLWTSIVDEVATETDPTRLRQLVKELNVAIDKQCVGRPRTPGVVPTDELKWSKSVVNSESAH